MAHVNNIDDELSTLSINSEDNYFDSIRKTNATSSREKLKECFDVFDKDRDGNLSRSEFTTLTQNLFCRNGVSYEMSEKQIEDIFKLLDENQDGFIDEVEFEVCWFHWLKQILDPVAALLIVDVQNDFISGTMAIKNCPAGHDGGAVVPVINSMVDTAQFDHVGYSLDWHPENHISFVENVHLRAMHNTSPVVSANARKLDTVIFSGPPPTVQKLWPAHCVQDSWGAELHPELRVVEKSIWVKKGTNPEVDSYSAFWDNNKLSQTSLVDELTSRGVTDVYVCGLAYDICVGATAIHALEHGFRTTLVEDASSAVCLQDAEETRQKLKMKNASLVNYSQVADMVSSLDRRPELGYQAVLNVAMAKRLLNDK